MWYKYIYYKYQILSFYRNKEKTVLKTILCVYFAIITLHCNEKKKKVDGKYLISLWFLHWMVLPLQIELTGSSIFEYIHPSDNEEMTAVLTYNPTFSTSGFPGKHIQRHARTNQSARGFVSARHCFNTFRMLSRF